jgi:hypothetical protein
MRNIMVGLAALGLLATGAAATAQGLPVPLAVTQPPVAQQVHWDGCGPRCWEHRRWERERALERHRWAHHRRWEEHRRWEDSRRYPPGYGHSPHY